MKKTILGLGLGLVLLLSGCSTSENSGTYTEGTVKYSDGKKFGVTRAEKMSNGGFATYDIGTGGVNGFIQMDGMVNDIGGVSLGLCKGARVADKGLQGTCILSIRSPGYIEKPIPILPPAPGDRNNSNIYDTSCEDTRNGDFDPRYNQNICNANGYFWCSVSKSCTDQPININECGASGSSGCSTTGKTGTCGSSGCSGSKTNK